MQEREVIIREKTNEKVLRLLLTQRRSQIWNPIIPESRADVEVKHLTALLPLNHCVCVWI